MSTSIALVTCAEVSSERRMCSAMPRRIARHRLERLARLRAATGGCRRRGCSRSGGAAPAERAGAGGRGRRRSGAGALPARPVSMNAWMSFFVTRPPGRCRAPAPGRCRARRRSARRPARRTSGRCRRLAARRAARARRALPARSAAAASGGRRLRAPAQAERGRRGRGCAGLAADPREHRADLDRLALLDEDLADDARGRARHLGVDLVGRDLEQRLVGLDRARRPASATW